MQSETINAKALADDLGLIRRKNAAHRKQQTSWIRRQCCCLDYCLVDDHKEASVSDFASSLATRVTIIELKATPSVATSFCTFLSGFKRRPVNVAYYSSSQQRATWYPTERLVHSLSTRHQSDSGRTFTSTRSEL
jgi:hypothetical protein